MCRNAYAIGGGATKGLDSGSYTQVFKYTDTFYKQKFALKRANKDLNEKELNRFRLELKQKMSVKFSCLHLNL
jgi:serine/threonine protein kinase